MSQSGTANRGVFPPGSVVETLTGNTGGPVGPDGTNNIDIVGDGVVSVAGNPGTNTLTISVDDTVATTFTTDSGVATPVANNIDIIGGTGIVTSAVGDTIVITASGGATPIVQLVADDFATASGNSVNILGGNNIVTSADNVSSLTIDLNGTTDHAVQVGNASGSLTSLGIGTTGQVLTGVTASDPVWAAPAASSISITGNTGGALVGDAFTFTGGTTGLSFGGSGSTQTLTFAGITANGGAVNLGTDNAANAITIGTGNVARNINIGLSGAAHVISIGTNSGASSLGLNAGTGDMTLISGDAITLDASGVLELNSTGGVISIGNDNNNQNINLGTAGTRTINIGSAAASIDIGGFAEGALITSNTGVVSTVTGTAGFVLTANAAGTPPSFQAAGGGGGGITTIDGDTGSATGSTVTFTTVSPNSDLESGQFSATGSTVTLELTDVNNNLFMASGSGGAGTMGTYNVGISGALGTIGSGAGNVNIAIGNGALGVLTNGSNNIAIGQFAFPVLIDGNQNIGIGRRVGFDGSDGVIDGTANIFIGDLAGSGCVGGSESQNIYLNAVGTTESQTLRIGESPGITSAYIWGISGVVVTGSAVLVSAGNQLGVASSSARFKYDINDMGDDSSPVMNLKPVTFLWDKKSAPGLANAPDERQFGLIAEEVAEVMPYLVEYKEGVPFSVKYNELPAILLNELQKLSARVEELEKRLKESV